MADIFNKVDVEKLLENKSIWFFGDSNMRGIYKDLIWLLEKNSLINLNMLKGKLEGSFMNDVLVKGGSLHRGRNFQEVRGYKNFKTKTKIEFTFITQCYSNNIKDRLEDAYNKKEIPDVVIINSCVWDITRWGPESIPKYKSNVIKLLELLKSYLLPKTKVVWITTPPISNEPRGGFFIKQIEFLKHTLRFDVMEANTFVSREFILGGFDVLDVHYHLLMQIHRRRPDGIHWSPEAIRHITNLILTHLSLAWNVPLPGKFKSPLLDQLLQQNSNITDVKSTEAKDSVVTNIAASNGVKAVADKISKTKKKNGRKRDRNGNFLNEKHSSNDFTSDVFDYDYNKKRFKVAERRNF